MATNYTNLPDFHERKGSLFMRSGHMNYSRATLNSNWHQAREAEPKNYDISNNKVRDLCKATYDRIGNVTDGTLPATTYQHMAEQYSMKEDFTEKDCQKPMVNDQTCLYVDLDRETGAPKRGFGSVLPHHHPEHDKRHLETTSKCDYKAPYPYTPAQEKPVDMPDYSAGYKQCHSQFTDTADYRRSGRNTWQDESGLYMNTHFKAQTPVYQRTDPITQPLE